jgi:hypothetical protein
MNQEIIVLCLAAALTGCSNPDEDERKLSAALDNEGQRLASSLADGVGPSTGKEDELVFKLAFGEEADLDIYVTDPLLETVYFANHRSKSGGRIIGDIRCDTEGPRMEEVRFADPLPGKYRVGIDLPERCDERQTPAAYAVSVDGPGVSRRIHGVIPLQYFEVVVLEFDLPADKSGEIDDQPH